MIINQNLTMHDKIILSAKDVAARFEAVFIDNLGLVDGQTYTFSANVNLSEGETASTILFDSDYKIQSGTATFTTKERNSFTFTNKEGVTSRVVCYAGVSGSTNGISAEYTNIKLEKGEQMTPFLPHKDNLPEEKQPFLPPEGNYKEIQAL